MLRYLSRIVNSTFKDGTGGCSAWSVSPGFQVRIICARISPIIFLYLNYLPSEALLSTTSISSL